MSWCTCNSEAVRRRDTNNGIAVHAWEYWWALRSRDTLRTQTLTVGWYWILSALHSGGVTCIITLHHLSVTIISHPIYLSIHVTIYSCLSVLSNITADEDPRTETFCNNCCQFATISLLKFLQHIAMSIYQITPILLCIHACGRGEAPDGNLKVLL